ncbi:MAG TPA: GAF domain-containing protein, partial [Candidatus Sulfotelmatobacter sp.]|nr:GAF domain-containing protein [Candidatus Sulfotelmatobacter sp.]
MNSLVHSERRQAEQLRAGEHRLLELIANRSPLESILASLTQFIEAQAPGMLCSVLLLDREGLHLRHGAAPSLPAAYVRAIEGSPIGPQAGSCGTAAFRKEPVFVADIRVDPLWVNYRELAARHGLRACWSVPILSPANQVLGTFAMYYHEPRRPSPAELQLIASAANLAKIALEHQRAEDALREKELCYRQLVDLLPVAVYTTDMEGRITLFNRCAAQLWGRTPQFETDQWCGSFRMYRPDGSPLPLEQCPMA